MRFSFLSQYSSAFMTLVVFVVMIATYWTGVSFSSRGRGEKGAPNLSAIEGPLLGLLALLLAFTFSMSASRFDSRRRILVEEANAIGTAILRSDLYPAPERDLFRADFRDYLETRIAFFETGFDHERVEDSIRQSAEISAKIWERAARLGHDQDNFTASNQMIPALNAMIDIVTTRNAARHATVPDSIIWVLFALCTVSSFLVGYGRKEEASWIVVVIFALMISASIFLILDLDRPSNGLITLEETNKTMVDLRSMFQSDPER